MTSEQKRAYLDEYADDTGKRLLLADGFEDAIIGIGHQFNKSAVVYDKEACIRILVDGEMTEEEAEEYFEFNVQDAYLGDGTPIFMSKIK